MAAFESRLLGRTSLRVSPFGFGCNEFDDRHGDHRRALELALNSGINLVNTITNYGDGRSELAVGQVLKNAFASGICKREEVVVVTRVGYLQRQKLEAAGKRAEVERLYPDMVTCKGQLWHCMSPDFLEDQISTSLERLALHRLDVVLLHNPEFYFKVGKSREEFYRRVKVAFEHLEAEVDEGRIQYYGISSNSFSKHHQHPEFISLERILELANEIATDHHFAVIEFPFNVFEAAAMLTPNHDGRTLVEVARQVNLGTLINRPLSSMISDQLVRLAEFRGPRAGEDPQCEMDTAIEKLLEFESTFPKKSLEDVIGFSMGNVLCHNLRVPLSDLFVWRDARSHELEPVLERARQILASRRDTAS